MYVGCMTCMYGKRPGGSDLILASGGGVTEKIDYNERSHSTLDGVVWLIIIRARAQNDIVCT